MTKRVWRVSLVGERPHSSRNKFHKSQRETPHVESRETATFDEGGGGGDTKTTAWHRPSPPPSDQASATGPHVGSLALLTLQRLVFPPRRNHPQAPTPFGLRRTLLSLNWTSEVSSPAFRVRAVLNASSLSHLRTPDEWETIELSYRTSEDGGKMWCQRARSTNYGGTIPKKST